MGKKQKNIFFSILLTLDTIPSKKRVKLQFLRS